jgi:acetate kinase
MKILVLNAGSSSQKASLYELAGSPPSIPPPPLWEAEISWDEAGGLRELTARNASGGTLKAQRPAETAAAALAHLLGTLWSGATQAIARPSDVDVVGHRVVHGGRDYREPTLITPEVKAAIGRLALFAPLHNRADLEVIEAVEQLMGTVPQVAVFDTAFHSELPMAAAVYPGPYEWYERGIRRYGFHGINHQYAAGRAAAILGRELDSLRLITCHLGNGCSLAAIHRGRSIDTTMGFTPLDGLMMGTRSGSVDPGILIHLLRQDGCSAERLNQALNRESGLLGISGVTSDMREILAAMENGNARARLAFDVYVHRLRSEIGSMLAALGGLDALVFTAGVGENAARVREAACEPFGFLGLELDREKNARSPADQDISSADSAARVLIVHAREDWAIARACWRLAAETRVLNLP